MFENNFCHCCFPGYTRVSKRLIVIRYFWHQLIADHISSEKPRDIDGKLTSSSSSSSLASLPSQMQSMKVHCFDRRRRRYWNLFAWTAKDKRSHSRQKLIKISFESNAYVGLFCERKIISIQSSLMIGVAMITWRIFSFF